MVGSSNKPKRVAVVYHYFAHYREPVIHELIEHSDNYYHFFGDTQSFNSGIKLTDVRQDRFTRTKCHALGPLLFQWGAVKVALKRDFDVLVLLGNCKWPTMWLAAIFGKLTGKRVLFWTHGWLQHESGLQALIRNSFYRIGDGLLLYGHRAKCFGINYGFKPEALHVIYNSLDCRLQDRTRAALSENVRNDTRLNLFPDRSQYPVLINITRIHAYKKLDQIIHAAAALEKQGQPVNVLIVGEGPHKSTLQNLAGELGVHAKFTGAVYGEEQLARMLIASDIAVMPGPIGLLAMHAISYGVPVITHDSFDKQMPEAESIIEGKTGAFFREDDIGSLVDTIAQVLDLSQSFEERSTVIREVIERFYNPITQRILIDRAVMGKPADDLHNGQLARYSEMEEAKC